MDTSLERVWHINKSLHLLRSWLANVDLNDESKYLIPNNEYKNNVKYLVF